MSVVCVVALVTDRIHHLPSARVALIESNKPGRRVELPGGKALEGEPPYLATRREMREELGIEVTNLEPLQSIHGEPRPGAEFTSAIWVFRGRTAAAMLVAGDDAKRAFWASRQDVLELERHGCLSDLASKAVLLDWARQAPEVAPEAPVSAADVAVPMLRMASEHLDEIGRLRAEIASLRAAKAAPLTEEEARRWLDRIFGGSGAGEAPEGSFRDALLSASRGEIPPEVRASATVSRDPGHPLPTPPAGEMAVTDGAEGETP